MCCLSHNQTPNLPDDPFRWTISQQCRLWLLAGWIERNSPKICGCLEENSDISLLLSGSGSTEQQQAGLLTVPQHCHSWCVKYGLGPQIWEIPAGFDQETRLPGWPGLCVHPGHSRTLSLGQLSCKGLLEFVGKWTRTAQLSVKSLALNGTGRAIPVSATDGVNSRPASALQTLPGTASPSAELLLLPLTHHSIPNCMAWPSTDHGERPCPHPNRLRLCPKGQRAKSFGVRDKSSPVPAKIQSGPSLLGRWWGNGGFESSWLFTALGCAWYFECWMDPSEFWGQSILPAEKLQDFPVDLSPGTYKGLPALSFHLCLFQCEESLSHDRGLPITEICHCHLRTPSSPSLLQDQSSSSFLKCFLQVWDTALDNFITAHPSLKLNLYDDGTKPVRDTKGLATGTRFYPEIVSEWGHHTPHGSQRPETGVGSGLGTRSPQNHQESLVFIFILWYNLTSDAENIFPCIPPLICHNGLSLMNLWRQVNGKSVLLHCNIF